MKVSNDVNPTIVKKTLRSKDDWIELFPFGLTMGVDHMRPVMIFKDREETTVLPVWLSPIDAGNVMSQGQLRTGSPHAVACKVFEKAGIKISKCLFSEVKNNQQYVKLFFDSNPPLAPLEFLAQDAISLCVKTGAPFFANQNYVDQSRVLEDVMFKAQGEKLSLDTGKYLN